MVLSSKYILKNQIVRIGAILLCLLLLFLIFINRMTVRGKKTKKEVVSVYLTALERKSEESILSLIPSTHNAKKEIYDKIQKFGGHCFQHVKVDYISEFGPLMSKIIIRGSYASAENQEMEFTDEIYLQKIKTRWYLILGKKKDGIPESFPETKP